MKTTTEMEDEVLDGQHGPVYTYVEGPDKEHAGIGIRQTGPLPAFAAHELAAERLVEQGLLKRAFNGDPVHYYAFTTRGKIAHWAIREYNWLHTRANGDRV